MNQPDTDLLNLIKEHWALTDEGLTSEDVKFTEVGWRSGSPEESEALKALFGVPNIWIERISIRRLTDTEEYFNYTANVHVVYWCTTKDASDVQKDKQNHWKMIEHVKKLVQATATSGYKTNPNWPSNWNHAKIDSTMQRNVVPPIPPILIETITVSIRLFWEPD
jgi:hypothetical protein